MEGIPNFSESPVSRAANGVPTGRIQEKIMEAGGSTLSVEPVRGNLVLIDKESSPSPATWFMKSDLSSKRASERKSAVLVLGIGICLVLSFVVVRSWSRQTPSERVRVPAKVPSRAGNEMPVEMHPIQVDQPAIGKEVNQSSNPGAREKTVVKEDKNGAHHHGKRGAVSRPSVTISRSSNAPASIPQTVPARPASSARGEVQKTDSGGDTHSADVVPIA